MRKPIIFAAALVLLTAPALWAEFLEIEAAQMATIEPADKSVGARILVKWDLPQDLNTKIIDGAVVTLTLPHEGDVPFEVDVHPVTKSWDAATVTWSEGWEKPGGDFREDLASPAIVTERNEGKISADVYMTVTEQIAGTTGNFGFILVPEAGTEAKISPIVANAPARLADAKLIIAYRNRR